MVSVGGSENGRPGNPGRPLCVRPFIKDHKYFSTSASRPITGAPVAANVFSG